MSFEIFFWKSITAVSAQRGSVAHDSFSRGQIADSKYKLARVLHARILPTLLLLLLFPRSSLFRSYAFLFATVKRKIYAADTKISSAYFTKKRKKLLKFSNVRETAKFDLVLNILN